MKSNFPFVSVLLPACAVLSFLACSKGSTNEKTVPTIEKHITKENTMKTIHLTKTDFLAKVANYEASPQDWKYLGDKPALIDFYADWCGPCKMIAPILEELAAEYANEIYIYKINTEQEPELAAAFGIRSIPSLLFVPLNKEPQMSQGAMSKADFKRAIESVLLEKK